MQRLLQLEDATIRWLRIVALIGFAAIIIGSVFVTGDALLRSFFGRPVRGMSEIIDISTAIVIATCFPIGMAQRRNIRITVLHEYLGPAGTRVLDVIGDIALLVFVTLVAVELVAYTIEAIRLHESSLVLQIPKGPFWAVASAIMLLSVPAQLLMTLISIAYLFNPPPSQAAPQTAH